MIGQKSEPKINNKRLDWLYPILKNWIVINKDYIEQFESGDCLYWYNERANISAFAGAVWKSGGFALEEYSTKKGFEANLTNGRIDLYFLNDTNEAIAEAKMAWLYFGNKTRLAIKEQIDRVSENAMRDIKNSLAANPCGLGLGISFISTYWRENYDATAEMQSLREFMKTYDCAFYAIFENTSGKDIVNLNKNVYNAVVLVGKVHDSTCNPA